MRLLSKSLLVLSRFRCGGGVWLRSEMWQDTTTARLIAPAALFARYALGFMAGDAGALLRAFKLRRLHCRLPARFTPRLRGAFAFGEAATGRTLPSGAKPRKGYQPLARFRCGGGVWLRAQMRQAAITARLIAPAALFACCALIFGPGDVGALHQTPQGLSALNPVPLRRGCVT